MDNEKLPDAHVSFPAAHKFKRREIPHVVDKATLDSTDQANLPLICEVDRWGKDYADSPFMVKIAVIAQS